MEMKKIGLRGLVAVVLLAAGWFARGLFGPAGGPPPMRMPQMPPAAVRVITLKEQALQPAREYIARVEPVQDVLVRAEVSGTIASIHFTEGSQVEAGDLLFTIDPAPYRATVTARTADLAQARAAKINAERYLNRLREADARSISKTALDTAESDFLRAEAAVQQAEAHLALAQIHLGYTEVRAAVSGRIGAADVRQGNLVGPSTGPLARIVQAHPARVVFSMPDRDWLEQNRLHSGEGRAAPVARVLLPNGSVLDAVGQKEFDDNVVNPATGTLSVRYLFENAEGLLLPGGLVTARVEHPDREKGIRIPLRALLMDSQGVFVLTVDDEGRVSQARVVPGEQVAGDVVIRSGLRVGDRVIVDGVQKAAPGAVVQAVEMEEAQ